MCTFNFKQSETLIGARPRQVDITYTVKPSMTTWLELKLEKQAYIKRKQHFKEKLQQLSVNLYQT